MRWLRNNSLSLVFFLLFLFSMAGQALTGWKQYNEEMQEKGGEQVGLTRYLTTPHFAEATFENWESEFLQMALYVVLSISLYQKGSSESKDPDKKQEEVDREPDPSKKDAPWPVKVGGLVSSMYNNSLTIALSLLFLVSFFGHFQSSLKEYNHEQLLQNKPAETAAAYLAHSKFWFESFQNWQSEFLSVLSIVVLSIFLRQKGSAQSKPVDAPVQETGD